MLKILMKKQYKHLFFDLDNTLWDFATNSKVAMKETIENLDLLHKLDSFDSFFDKYEKINHNLWEDYHQKKITKQNLIVRRFSESLSEYGIDYLDWTKVNSLYLDKMALQTQLFSGVLNTLEYLKKKEYKMYIITNGFKEVQYKKLYNCNISHYFSKCFISEEIQTTKPSRKIFEHSLKSSNASKKESIMIGDSWETDILGALNFGIDQIMFLNNEKNALIYDKNEIKIEKTTQLKPGINTYFVNNISEITSIL